MHIGSRLQLRCFLEGIEVPVVAASISGQINAAASASIQLPANDYLLDIKPRTLVHLFCYDGYAGAPTEEQARVGGFGVSVRQKMAKDPAAGSGVPDTASPREDETLAIDLENANYKLIFGGEVVGVSYQKAPDSRAMVLQCMDWSSYWDIAYQYQLSGMSLGNGSLNQAFTGASATVFRDFLEGSGDIVLRLLSTAPKSYPGLKGTLLGGIMHIIEAIGGTYYGKKAVTGVNDFFSLAEMRLHLTQMVGASPFSAKDELSLLRANGFGSLFSKELGGLGNLVTVRQVLRALQQYIFHEIVPITSPRYRPAKGGEAYAQVEQVPLAGLAGASPIIKAATLLKARALELVTRQQACVSAEACAVQSRTRGRLEQELRGLWRTAHQAYKSIRRLAGSLALTQTESGLALVSAAFETTASAFEGMIAGTWQAGSLGCVLPQFGTGAAGRVISALQGISERMERVLNTTVARPAAAASAQPEDPARLFTQVYRPDVWMVAPPRCNVLFPDHYFTLQYGRSYLDEVSRMLLRTHEAFFGSDVLFDGFYMAPSRLLGQRKGKKMAVGRTGVEPPDLSDAPAYVLRDLMDHELYTGILPTFERMSDLNLHAIRGGSLEINGMKVGYAQIACNHIFYQHRFHARQLSVAGRFNPYAVLGFPMVVIDKYAADDQLQGQYDAKLARSLATAFSGLPSDEYSNVVEAKVADIHKLAVDLAAERDATHYMGTPVMIMHSIDASSGGTTSFQMGYARTTGEKTEFLGDNTGGAPTATRVKNVTQTTVVAALKPPAEGDRGYLGGLVTKVVDVTDAYARSQPRKGRTGPDRFALRTLLPIWETGSDRPVKAGRKKQLVTRVPVGVELIAAEWGPEVVALAGSAGNVVAADGGVTVTFRAYKVEEQLGSFKRTEVELPPEELCFPPWYSDNWRTKKVGGIYSYLFGTGSVTDPTVVHGFQSTIKFGEGEADNLLDLSVQSIFDAVAGPEAAPPPGLSSIPNPVGGGLVGQPGPVDPLGEVKARSALGEAIKELATIYGLTRSQNYDTAQFVHSYTWRPIATMVDIFGTADLKISSTGLVLSGREGFHSRAFGDVDDLRQLAVNTAGMQRILGLETKPSELSSDTPDASAKIAGRLDTRKEKRLYVMRYLAALAASRGVLLG